MPAYPTWRNMRPNKYAEISSPNKRNWGFVDEMIRGSRTTIKIENGRARHSKVRGDGQTYEGSHSSQELRLHGLPFRKTTANEDAVVGDLMRDLMSEARQGRSGADHGTRIKRCGQARFTNEVTRSKRNQRNRVFLREAVRTTVEPY